MEADGSLPPKTHGRLSKIPVVCVSSHHHALEHIHDILRRRRLLTKSWSMLHFDSHADLACPGAHIPAVCCFQPRRGVRIGREPTNGDDTNGAVMWSTDDDDEDDDENKKNLYELLDSTASGIAEWMLPLVVAANLTTVHWVRPSTTVRLIPSGAHEYHVGAWIRGNPTVQSQQCIQSFLDLPHTATVKVDWNCSYYAEDGSCVPRNELLLAKPLHLIVDEGSTPLTYPRAIGNTTDSTSDEFIFSLDICLDFFACLNPFVVEIEALDGDFAHALVAVVIEAELYERKEDSVIESLESHSSDVAIFRQLLQRLLEARLHTSTKIDDELFRNLVRFYESEEKARCLIESIANALRNNNDKRRELIQLALEAIPNLTMPHELLPNASEWAIENRSIQKRLESLSDVINGNPYHSHEPFIITVARSSDDGFTPPTIVAELQDAVMNTIHKRYCGCSEPNLRPLMTGSNSCRSDCRFDLIFDYGEWEGSSFKI